MKRTKEAFFRFHPDSVGREALSGCREFDGEDLDYYQRKKFYNERQKEWLDQQIKEKEELKDRQRFNEHVFAQQTQMINTMRIELEQDHSSKLREVNQNVKAFNHQQQLERKDREKFDREQQLKKEREELQLLERRNVKRALNRPF